jgi:hypothetical protein
LDIKDLYVNLPIHNILSITKFWLHKNNNQRTTVKQILELIEVVINQNYFQYNDKYFKPIKGIVKGSPLSSNLAEIYLQYFEELIIKYWTETWKITYYRRYVEEIIIIFDINEDTIMN